MANVVVWAVWIVAAFSCLASGIAVVTFTNPFYSALALIGNLASLAVLYLLLSAEFVAAGQVLVYAGAVMVMFLFVTAYLGGRADAPWAGGPSWQQFGAVLAPDRASVPDRPPARVRDHLDRAARGGGRLGHPRRAFAPPADDRRADPRRRGPCGALISPGTSRSPRSCSRPASSACCCAVAR
ncbi:MAG: hypothetical protein E6G23_02015 [Actinobacteria bacterium]|nr:MAG: hypothetical protein E6G23_02015 [Actinomycetota bacterium]